MTKITYESIEHLIQDVEVEGRRVNCSFLHRDGQVIRSTATITRDNSTISRVGRTVKNQLITRARATAAQSIFRMLGGGMLGRAGSTIIRASVPTTSSFNREPEEEAIRQALISAFDRISDQYVFDAVAGEWNPAHEQKIKITSRSAPADVKTEATPICDTTSMELNRLEKEVLARLLLELGEADGILSEEEEALLRSVLPRELHDLSRIRKMDYISPLELRSLSEEARSKIIRCGFQLVYADFRPHDDEMSVLHTYATQMGLPAPAVRQLEKEAKKDILLSVVDENTGRKELFELAAQINISEEEAEMLLIRLKSNIR